MMQDVLGEFLARLTAIAGRFLGAGERLSPFYLLIMIVIAFVLWRFGRGTEQGGFWSWLFPRSIYFHRSHWVDIKLFVFGRLFSALGLLNRLALGTAVSAGVIALLAVNFGTTQQSSQTGFWQMAALTVVFAAVADFSTYWVHRLHHENPVLWPFHAVHHSAEVLTPITLYRKHPVYDLLGGMLRALLVGIATGIVIYAFFGKISVLAIGGANLIYCAFNFVGSNLRHSHVWFSYGPVLERIFISPAQHQIHHSRLPRHHDRNYGEIFALWDWMFGTLYLPRGRETFEIGLADAAGNSLPQPHGTLRAALLEPFAASARALREVVRRRILRKPVLP
jgi:sterol desaturase/sphingolipid hydroxylase (fatty acid hydroxylase superfamily)